MLFIFIKCGQELKEKVGLFAKRKNKHHVVQSQKGWPVTFDIRAGLLKRVDQVVKYWRYSLSLAYKDCKRCMHSQIYVGDVAKDLAMREQKVGIPQELANGHESAAIRGNIFDGFGYVWVQKLEDDLLHKWDNDYVLIHKSFQRKANHCPKRRQEWSTDPRDEGALREALDKSTREESLR